MLKPHTSLLCLLVAFVGCSTASRRDAHSPVSDWNAVDQTRPPELEQVAEPAPVAPPPKPLELPPVPRTNHTYAETWIPLNRWSRDHHAGVVRHIPTAPVPTFALMTTNGTFVLQAGNLAAKWDGLELRLGFAPQVIDGQLYVHELDLRKNVEPLIAGLQLPEKTNRTVVIDPGHGGSNAGARSVADQVDEKEFTLDWARRLEPLLAAEGWDVFLTRTNDADVPLGQRVTIADEHEADLFISLHFNSAAPNQQQAGLETFCFTPSGMASTLTRGYEDNTALVSTNNAFDAENIQYAVRLHRSLLKIGDLTDRGVRRARFLTVLRGQNRPAVLIEAGYLSNPSEARRIADAAYRQKLAEAVARALATPEPTNPQLPPPTNSLTRGSQSPEAGVVNSNAATATLPN